MYFNYFIYRALSGNLMHISYESGMLEDPSVAPHDDMMTWTRAPRLAPDESATLRIHFRRGIPTMWENTKSGEKFGEDGDALQLVETLNEIA